jgi:hypothetical protein
MDKERVIEQTRKYLDENDWHYEYVEDKHVIRFNYTMKSCKISSLRLFITFSENGFSVLTISSMNADESSRQNVMEYITRANYGLRNGNFEMDVRDGEVRYKTFVFTKCFNSLPDDIFEQAIYTPLSMFSRYGNGMAALMVGFSDPETEIKKAEEAE